MKTRALSGIAHEAARILCEESLTDYRLAKQKAALRLGLGSKAALPRNADVEAAVLEYQRLFGGTEYSSRLQNLRATAAKAMKLLARFDPRLVGGVISGAITDAHRVQLHVFGEKPESLDMFFQDHGIRYEQDEREYRFPDGSTEMVPLVKFEAGDVGVDVACFPDGEQRRLPLSPADGALMKRLGVAEVETLAAQRPDLVA
jgi:hypothetical protein